jgi:hypothetical protein
MLYQAQDLAQDVKCYIQRSAFKDLEEVAMDLTELKMPMLFKQVENFV